MSRKLGTTWSTSRMVGKRWDWDANFTLVRKQQWVLGITLSGSLMPLLFGVLINKKNIVVSVGILTLQIYWY